jgi:hypothetical protein
MNAVTVDASPARSNTQANAQRAGGAMTGKNMSIEATRHRVRRAQDPRAW